jgi:uncharacterized FlgJ-related protein
LTELRQKEDAGARLTLEEQTRRDLIARMHGSAYKDLDALLEKVDVVPPSLAIAQAALATGWGGEDRLVARNALFGRGSGGGAFDDLVAAAADYAAVLNAHPDFADLRARRAELRAAGGPPTGAALAPFIGPYAKSGKDYAQTVASVIASQELGRYDAAIAVPEDAAP